MRITEAIKLVGHVFLDNQGCKYSEEDVKKAIGVMIHTINNMGLNDGFEWSYGVDGMGPEDMEYGETYELRNGDSCVYVCRNLEEETDDETQLMSFELVLINAFMGEEHNINDYNDGLTHVNDKELDIVN